MGRRRGGDLRGRVVRRPRPALLLPTVAGVVSPWFRRRGTSEGRRLAHHRVPHGHDFLRGRPRDAGAHGRRCLVDRPVIIGRGIKFYAL